MIIAGSIRVLQQILVEGVVYSRSGKALRYALITTFSTKAVIAYLPTLAFVGIVDGFQDYFYQLRWASIRFSSKSNNRQQAISLIWSSRSSKVTIIFFYN